MVLFRHRSNGAHCPDCAFQPQLPCSPQLWLQLCASVLLRQTWLCWPPPLLLVVLQWLVHQPVSIGAITVMSFTHSVANTMAMSPNILQQGPSTHTASDRDSVGCRTRFNME